jgi:hypothetical protein
MAMAMGTSISLSKGGVNFITTSRRDRTLEAWFILGTSSPNGRTIQVGEILFF